MNKLFLKIKSALNLLEISRSIRAKIIVQNNIKFAKKNGVTELSFYLCPDNKICAVMHDGEVFYEYKSSLNLSIIETLEAEFINNGYRTKIAKAKYTLKNVPNRIYIFDCFTLVLDR